MGYVVIALYARFNRYDVYADPPGGPWWSTAYTSSPPTCPHAGAYYLGWLAGLVSIRLWIRAVIDAFDDADPSLAWAVELPQFAFGALLRLALSNAASPKTTCARRTGCEC